MTILFIAAKSKVIQSAVVTVKQQWGGCPSAEVLLPETRLRSKDTSLWEDSIAFASSFTPALLWIKLKASPFQYCQSDTFHEC